MDQCAIIPRLTGGFKGKFTFESGARAPAFSRLREFVLIIGLKRGEGHVSGTDIFLSYARNDQSIARMFADRLVMEGFAVWWDASLRSGQTFDEVIEKQLRDSKAVVVLWSPRSVASRWVRAEATLADRRNKLVPAIIEACDRPIIFELTHAADLCDWEGDTSDARWKTFVLDLKQLVEAEAGASSPLEPPARPEPPAPKASAGHLAAAPPAAYEPKQSVSEVAADDQSPSAELHCLEIEPGELIGDPVAITSSSMRIGRCAPSEVILPHKSVSREHCVIGLANDELLVTDQNSTNGTYINGVRITRATILPVGSILKLGEVSLKHAVRTDTAARPHSQFRQASAVPLQAGRLAAAS